MNIKILGGVLVAALTITTAANAQSGSHGFKQTERRHERRITQGVRSGELTRHEARSLRREERMVRQDKRLARADGRVTLAERRQIRREESRLNRDIYRKKHNNRLRG